MRTLVPLPVVALVLAAGCGGGDEVACGSGTEERSRPGTAEVAYLTDVRVVDGECDRIEFLFEEAVPGVQAGYEAADTALSADGSGNAVPLDGEAFLVVRLEPAMTARAAADGTLTITYDGPPRFGGETPLVKTGDFEAVVRWTIGLDEERPFDVRVVGGRVVVSIG